MTAQNILDRVNQKPFRPFAIETVGGTWIDVERQEDILVHPRNNRVVIFSASGSMFIFDPDQISAIEAK